MFEKLHIEQMQQQKQPENGCLIRNPWNSNSSHTVVQDGGGDMKQQTQQDPEMVLLNSIS